MKIDAIDVTKELRQIHRTLLAHFSNKPTSIGIDNALQILKELAKLEAPSPIFEDEKIIVPLGFVQHIEKVYTPDTGALRGAAVITKHTTWNTETDYWHNNIWLDAAQAENFLSAWRAWQAQQGA